jgi:hypothetical protein
MTTYTSEQLCKKYKGKFINTLAHHYSQMDKRGNYITVYEVSSVKSKICENHNPPEDEIRRNY